MTDTIRSAAYLTGTEFVDGQVRTLSAQYMRDFVVSVPSLAERRINVLDYLTAGQPDGTTDNTTQIQAAINAAAGKATIYIPQTTNNYIFSGFTIPSNTHLVVDGYLLCNPSVSSSSAFMIQTATGTSNILVEGRGTFDGNKAGTVAPGIGPILPNQATNILFRDFTVKNTYRGGIGGSGCVNAVLDNLTITNTSGVGFNGTQFGGGSYVVSNNTWVRNCRIDASNDQGLDIYQGVINSGLINNIITNTGGGNANISVLWDGGPNPNSNILISGNIIQGIVGSAGDGIQVIVNNGVGIQSNINICNNMLTNCRATAINIGHTTFVTIENNFVNNSSGNGIKVQNSSADVTIKGNTLIAPIAVGIDLETVTRVDVIGNFVMNCSGGPNPAAIWLNSCTDSFISNNHFVDSAGSPTMTNGIYSASGPGSGAVIINNKTTNIPSPYNLTPAADTVLVKLGVSASNATDYISALTAPTRTAADNTTNVATTAFVTAAIAGVVAGGAGGQPYFQAYLSANQTSISTATPTKVLFNTTVFDSGSYYDHTTNFRFTPLVAGLYHVTVSVDLKGTPTSAGTQAAFIYKNGSEIKRRQSLAWNTNATELSQIVTALVQMNGTTDYLEGWGEVSGTSGLLFGGGANLTWFEASFVGP